MANSVSLHDEDLSNFDYAEPWTAAVIKLIQRPDRYITVGYHNDDRGFCLFAREEVEKDTLVALYPGSSLLVHQLSLIDGAIIIRCHG